MQLLLLFVTISSGLVDIFFNELVLLCDTDDESSVAANQPVRGSFLNLLPPQMEVPEKSESQ